MGGIFNRRHGSHLVHDEPSPVSAANLAEDLYPIVSVPFYERDKIMRLRRLSANQCKAAVGDVVLTWGEIEPEVPGKHKMEVSEGVSVLDIMDGAARAVMMEPSYDDVVAELDALRPERSREKALAEIDDIRKLLQNYADENHPEVIALQERADDIRAMEKYPLPEDAYQYLFLFAIRADSINMKAYSKADAMMSAVLGERYGKRPSEIVGIDPEKMAYLAQSYDKMATTELEEYRRMNDRIKKRGMTGAVRRG